ncbi:DUF4181 domain-containing protein [Planococcus sp. CAU13]|uniref:DUF4181 domain-containing protein n=1 Tax=Planococcus sp. CAU13 TaxID=1541197 RepID=UPI00052FFEF5|nr:DUF4181 domain-containing protein [Planococcus sp. CAU13]
MIDQISDPNFAWKLIVILAIFIFLSIVFNAVARKLLNVEKQKFFSFKHINDKHKKFDWTIRTLGVVSIIIGYAINITRPPSEWFWFLHPWVILILFLIISQLGKAIMERKYAENPNLYKVTVGETVFIGIFLFSLYWTDFWGFG